MSESKGFSLSQQQQTVIGITTLVLAVVVVLFSGTSSITMREAKSLLDRYAAHMSHEASAQQRVASFQHGKIVVEGWGNDKRAIVPDVSITLSDAEPSGSEFLSASTPQLVIKKDRMLSGKYSFHIKSPIRVTHQARPAYNIESEQPLIYGFYQDGHAKAMQHSIRLPSELVIRHGAQDGVTVLMGPNRLRMRHTLPSGSKETQYELANVIVKDSRGSRFTADSIAGRYTAEPQENEQVAGDYDVKVNHFTTYHDPEYTYNLALEGSYQGDPVQLQPASLRPAIRNTVFDVNKAALMGEDFSIIGVGELRIAEDDPLPSGMLDVEIVNAQGFVDSSLVPSALKLVVEAALKRASGTKEQFAERTAIPVKRDKNGVLYLGGITFEEMTAAVLSDLLQSAMPDKQAPAEVADELPPLPEGAPTLEEMPDLVPVVPPSEAIIKENTPQMTAPDVVGRQPAMQKGKE